jgi:hypothetical protein
MKKLPEIYKNNINRHINNNKKYCYLENINESNSESLDDKLNYIFKSTHHPYNINVIIKTKDKVYNTSLVTKKKNNLITIDNDIIPLNEIVSLDIKKD